MPCERLRIIATLPMLENFRKRVPRLTRKDIANDGRMFVAVLDADEARAVTDQDH